MGATVQGVHGCWRFPRLGQPVGSRWAAGGQRVAAGSGSAAKPISKGLSCTQTPSWSPARSQPGPLGGHSLLPPTAGLAAQRLLLPRGPCPPALSQP